ncbi:MAG: AAA family ATPase [Pirellulales bacterium]
MRLTDQLHDYVQAAFTGLWVQTHEPDEAEKEILQHAQQHNWRVAVWDIAQGVRLPGATSGTTPDAAATDPLAALRSLTALASPVGTAILLLHNFHRFLNSPEIVQTMFDQLLAGKDHRTFLVVLSPVVQIPIELEKLFVVIEHELPGREQLEEIACGIGTEEGELPSGPEMQTLLDAASGLTRYEAEAAFSLSLVRHGHVQPDAVWELKTQTLKKSGLLTLHRGNEDFNSLGGLSALKTFTKRALLQPSRGNPLKRPRGVLLLSPPGCGKSQFCKTLGKEVGRPVLILDVGPLMGSLVGQSEERTRQALRIIDAMAPCVAMIDEVEKAFSGVNGNGDSGVSSRMFGTFLSWLNDHESDVFVVCTANDVSKLPPEFSRAERFDAVFFLDLPGSTEKEAIWNLYLEQFEIERGQRLPDDTNWTGAEIRACCRLAALLDLPLSQAAQNVVPVAVTAAESVERLRTWATGRCLSADRPGIYGRNEVQPKGRRKIPRDPSVN